MATGKQVLGEIQSFISRVESDYNHARSKERGLEGDISGLEHDRESMYVQLAELYLPELDAESVKGTIHEMQQDVDRIFNAKIRRMAELDSYMESSLGERLRLNEQLDGLEKQLNEIAAKRDKITAKVKAELEADPAYKALGERASHAESQLTQNRARLEEAQAQAAEKLPAYDNNPLFLYLLKKGFGTPEYHASRLTSRLDRWVARLMQFHNQKQSYDRLITLPGLMEEEIERRQHDLDAVVLDLQEQEQAVSEKYGLPSVVHKGEQVSLRRNNMLNSLDEDDRNYRRAESEREALENTQGRYHKEAVGRIVGFLKGKSLEDLYRKARETPDPRDDDLVGKIYNVEQRIETVEEDLSRVREEIPGLRRDLEILQELERRFRRADYESDRSRFKGIDIEDFLTGYLLGRTSWNDLGRHQHFKPRPTYHSTSYKSSSSWDSSGGGFGGGGFKSGGGFGGGGFKSGGGF